MPNALAGETSPYLHQHRDNPVDWLPWGEAALALARERDVPVLVSIGYSACHWCHVMERECFEDDQIAALMNEHFVCVKVDREEHPDVDAVYMEAVQLMTGQGGWPLNVFVTPDQVPFYGGTYFPPGPHDRLPSWPQVLLAIGEAWRDKREEIAEQGAQMAERLGASARLRPAETAPGPATLVEAELGLKGVYDADHGGFGSAPKFPPHSVLIWLLERDDPDGMAARTLRRMAAGGLHDQVGGGFSRYAVDATWTVPHFEKMLYDNALALRAYAMAWRRTGDEHFADVARGIHRWMDREMRGSDGGWFAALDADTDHVEGDTYVWTVDELRAVLGDDAATAIAWLGATPAGNFADPHHPRPGLNVLTASGARPDPETAQRIRAALLEVRVRRPQPGVDDKRLAGWNALAFGALAFAGSTLDDAAMVADAEATADFVLRELRDDQGRLLRTYSRGVAKLPGVLEDHAFLLEALLDLHEATFEPRWYAEAEIVAGQLVDRFADTEGGGFFQTAADAPPLVSRRRDIEDAPIPSGSSSAALGLLRLAALSGQPRWREAGMSHLALIHVLCGQHPQAFGWSLRALSFALADVREVAIVGPASERAALTAVVRERLRPHVVLSGGDGDRDTGPALLEGRTPVDGRAAAYVCEGFACRAPVTEPDELRALLA